MAPELLAAAAAVAWGSSGLFAGVLSRARPALLIALTAQAAGAVWLAPVVAASGEAFTARAALTGAAGGAISAVGLVCLYAAFAGRAVGLAAPVAASGILVPVATGVLMGDALRGAQVAGFVLLVLGLAAVLHVPVGGRLDRRTLRLAVIAAVSFGAFYLALDAGGEDGVLWVNLFSRIGAVSAIALYVLRSRAVPRRAARAGRWLAAALVVGSLDTLGNLAYSEAARTGELSVVSLVSAAYPAVSVLLAVALLGERMSPVRAAGVPLTVLGLGLVAM